jgi:hypothetical protein
VPKAGWTTVRLLNVTASAPEGILVSPLAEYTFTPTDYYSGPVIEIAPKGESDTRIVIDAETGEIVGQVGGEQKLAALHSVLDTVRVSPLDPTTAPWPYADAAPPSERESWGSILYPSVDPLSGIVMAVGIASGDPAASGQCGYKVRVWNGRSSIFVNACTGEPYREGSYVDPEDEAAFNRLLKSIAVKP